MKATRYMYCGVHSIIKTNPFLVIMIGVIMRKVTDNGFFMAWFVASVAE